jgi:WhiB family transcriptional regulator, redox-sensing transcriptional regulator
VSTAAITDDVAAISTGMALQLPTEVLPALGSTAPEGYRPGTPDGVEAAVGLRSKSWMALAKCRDMKPAMFFPDDRVGVREAQQICAVCPVKLACLAYALENGLTDGVWGGISEHERRRILCQRPDYLPDFRGRVTW